MKLFAARGIIGDNDTPERGARVPYRAGSAVVPVYPVVSSPLRERNEGNDTTNYAALIPYATGNYQTYWRGNRLPSAYVHTAPHPYYVRVASQDYAAPQRSGGSFGVNYSMPAQNSLIERWHQIWSNARAAYSNG